MPRTAIASLAAAAIVAVLMAFSGVARSANSPTKDGRAFAQLLKKRRVITDAVNLDQDTVDVPLVCHDCTFTNSISAVGATFTRTVDLSGSTFEKRVDMSQATFEAPALFGPGERVHPSKAKPPSKQCAGEGAWFFGSTNFEFATFDGPAIFEGAVFKGQQRFNFAGFNGEALFTQGCSVGPASFERAVFGDVADFGGYSFRGGSNFVSAAFRGQTDFSQATFLGGVTFEAARFSQGAAFEVAKFGRPPEGQSGPEEDEDTYFDKVIAGGALDFSSATLQGFASYLFEGLRVSGDLSFSGATISPKCQTTRTGPPSTHCLIFGYADPSPPFSATTFELSVGDALRTVDDPERAAILQKIESSAKSAETLASQTTPTTNCRSSPAKATRRRCTCSTSSSIAR